MRSDHDRLPAPVLFSAGTLEDTGEAGLTRLSWRASQPAPDEASGVPILPTTLVCLPGLAHSAAGFDALAHTLAGWGLPVVALDPRGKGESVCDPTVLARSHVPDVVDDIEHMIAALDLEGRCVVLGHSVGGYLAQYYAQRRPVHGLVLLATSHMRDIGRLNASYARHPIASFPILRRGTDAFRTSRIARRAFLLGGSWTPERDRAVLAQLSPEIGGVLTDIRAMARGARSKGAFAYATPQCTTALVLGGTKDGIYPRSLFDRLARELSRRGLRVREQLIERAPHDLMLVDEFVPQLAMAIYAYCASLVTPLQGAMASLPDMAPDTAVGAQASSAVDAPAAAS